jgi:TolA-binding protein
MSKLSRKKSRRHEAKKPGVIKFKSTANVADKIIPSQRKAPDFVLDEEDAKKYFKEFLERYPGIEDANPAHEAGQYYLIERRLNHLFRTDAEFIPERFFVKLAHEWQIYPDHYPAGPKIPAHI